MGVPTNNQLAEGVTKQYKSRRACRLGGRGPIQPVDPSKKGPQPGNPFGQQDHPLAGIGQVNSPGMIEENLKKRAKKFEAKEMEKQKLNAMRNRLEADERRQARTPPEGDPRQLIEFLLDTDTRDMDFEVGRCARYLDDAFFSVLDVEIGKIRFDQNRDEDKLKEFELLRDYLREVKAKLGDVMTSSQKTQENLKFLFTAKNKKEAILELASKNMINDQLIEFIDINAQGAQDAKQEEIYEFLQKLKSECVKFIIRSNVKNVQAPSSLQNKQQDNQGDQDFKLDLKLD